jgi:hypothetical protein
MKRIKYASLFAAELTHADIEEIVTRAAARNATLGITGILMTSGRLFYQVIEGPDPEIDELFAAIRRDPRHRDILLLAEEATAERAFPDWGMRRVDLGADAEARLRSARELLVEVLSRRHETERLTRTLERAIWYELASALE